MLIKVNVCWKDSDQQCNDAPSRKPGEPRDKQADPETNLHDATQINQFQMKWQIGRHDFEEEAWVNQVHHACKDHQERQKPFENRFGSRHAILVTMKSIEVAPVLFPGDGTQDEAKGILLDETSNR